MSEPPDIPEHLLYTEEHEWVSRDDQICTIGITAYAQAELGDIVFVELPEVGDQVQQGEAFGTVEAVKTVAELYAPISGSIAEINQILEDHAELVNSDPYNDGWMIKIIAASSEELEKLLPPQRYAEFIEDL